MPEITQNLSHLAGAVESAASDIRYGPVKGSGPQQAVDFYRDKWSQIAQATDDAGGLLDVAQAGIDTVEELTIK